MKVKLPIIGQIATGKDKEAIKPTVKTINIPKEKSLLGTVLDMGTKSLSNEKSVSSKLIEAYYEWVYINISTLAEEVSKLEPILYKVVLKGGEYELQEVDDHPLLKLLDRFNETTTQSDAFYITEAHLDLTGDAFWYLEGGAKNKEPKNIYLLQPDKMELVLGDISTGASRLVKNYIYKTTVDGAVIEKTYEPEEILHIKVPNPKNPYRGHSVVEGLAVSLDIDSRALEANKGFYENGMMAQFMLSTENKLTQEQIKQLNAEMRAAYAGSKNFWKVPIFGGGIKPQTVQMSSRDAEMLAQQMWLRDKIMAGFKNTKASLGITEDVNRANAEATLLSWKQSTIKPKMSRIINSMNEFLVPRYGDNLVLGFKDPVPEDMTRKVADSKSLYDSGIITLNEARSMVDMDNVVDGDSIGTQAPAGIPLVSEELPKGLRSVNTKAVFRRIGIAQKKMDWQKAYESARPVARNIFKNDKPENRLSAKFTNEVIWDFWQKQINMVEVTEERFKNKAEQFISKMVDQGLAMVDNKEARSSKKLLDVEQLKINAVAEFTPILMEIAVASGNHANRLLGIDKPYIPKAMKNFDLRTQVTEQIELFAQSIIMTDESTMVDIIIAGLKEGSGIPEIKRAIQDKFAQFTNIQATRLTRTEVLQASNAGIEDAFVQSNVVKEKQWLTAGDPCPICDEMQGKTEKLGVSFLDKGDSVKYTGSDGKTAVYEVDYRDITEPPLHPNCRCTLIPVLANDKAFDTSSMTKIRELEASIDKRTKAYRELKQEKANDKAYIKALEELINE